MKLFVPFRKPEKPNQTYSMQEARISLLGKNYVIKEYGDDTFAGFETEASEEEAVEIIEDLESFSCFTSLRAGFSLFLMSKELKKTNDCKFFPLMPTLTSSEGEIEPYASRMETHSFVRLSPDLQMENEIRTIRKKLRSDSALYCLTRKFCNSTLLTEEFSRFVILISALENFCCKNQRDQAFQEIINFLQFQLEEKFPKNKIRETETIRQHLESARSQSFRQSLKSLFERLTGNGFEATLSADDIYGLRNDFFHGRSYPSPNQVAQLERTVRAIILFELGLYQGSENIRTEEDL